MNQSTTKLPKLRDEQWVLLYLLLRYRCLTLELLQHFVSGVDRETLRIRMCGLQKQRWAAKTILTGGEPCYALGTRAQRWFGLRHRSGFPFSEDSRLVHLGIATFCALTEHERLLPDEFRTRHPLVFRQGLPRQLFCLDRRDNESLCWVIVDRAREPRRLKSKAGDAIGRLLGKPEMERLMKSDKFRVVIITAVPARRTRIEEQLAADAPTAAPIEVLAIPSLLPLYLRSFAS